MDKSQVYDFLPVILIFSWMGLVVPFFPVQWRLPANYLGMGLCIGMMAMISELLKWQAASFTHLEATCRPSNIKLQLYVKEMETVEIEPGISATKLTLGEKVVHPFYGKLDPGTYIVVKHILRWEDRLQYSAGKAVFKDQIIDHPKSAKITLYEPEISDLDHLNPIPVFWLKEAPMDYYMPEDMDPALITSGIQAFGSKVVQQHGEKSTGASVMFQVTNQKREIEDLKTKNLEYKRQALDWHQKAVRLEEVNDQLKNELHAVLSSKSDQKQSVIEQVLTALEAHTQIRNALKELKGTNWLTKGLAILILAVIAIAAFMSNPTAVTTWLSDRQNQFFVIAIVGIVAFAYYLSKKGKK